MLKKALTILFISLGLLMALLGLFIFYSIQPALSPLDFAPQKTIRFEKYPTGTRQENQLKIATFNMGYASGDQNNEGRYLTPGQGQIYLEKIAQALAKVDADVLLLQEIDFYSWRSFDQNQLEYLAHRLKMPFGAYAVNWNKTYVAWPYWPLHRHFGRIVSGQAILSRFEIFDQKITTLPKPLDNPFWYNWFYIDRLIQRVRLRWGPDTISVYNVHLEAFDRPTRIQHLKILAEQINQDSHAAKLVGGDFNSRWTLTRLDEEELRQERQDLENFIQSTGLLMADPQGAQLTFPSWKPEKDLDYLFFSDTFLERESSVLTGLLASDHLLRWAELEWKNP